MQGDMMRFRIDPDKAIPRFVDAWLSHWPARAHFLQRAKSAVSQASINQNDVRTCPFPRLDVATQQSFLQKLDTIDCQITSEELTLSKLKDMRQGVADDLLAGTRRFREIT